MIDWYPILGNHEYPGQRTSCTGLQRSEPPLDHACPFTAPIRIEEKKGATVRIVWIDTAPLIDKYRNESATYPDACHQDMNDSWPGWTRC